MCHLTSDYSATRIKQSASKTKRYTVSKPNQYVMENMIKTIPALLLFWMVSVSTHALATGIDECTERYNLCIEAGQTFYDRCIERGNDTNYCAAQQRDGANACKRAMERCWKEAGADAKSSNEQRSLQMLK